jgi:hypothetical protein
MKEFKIGRYPSNDVVINDNTVSKFHAVLYVDRNTIIINDLNSKNGIYVNGSRIHGSANLKDLDIVRLGSALFQWKEYIHKPQVRITDPPTKPYTPPNPPYQPPYSPQPPIPQKQQNYTPIIIFAIILVFFGLAYLIVDANDNDRNSVPPVIVAPKPTDETDNQTKVEPVKPEPAPKPQMILLKHAEYEFYDSQEGMSYFSNVYPVMEGKYAFEFTTDYIEGDKYTYYETARDEAASILTLYSNEARETILVQITGNKSFKVIDGNSWIYKKNRRYQEYLGPGC